MATTKKGYETYDESKNNVIQQAKWEWEQANARGDEAGKAAARKKAEDERNRLGYATSGDGTSRTEYKEEKKSKETPVVKTNTYVAPSIETINNIDESSNNIIQRGKELWEEGDRTGNEQLKKQGREMAEAERNRLGYSTDGSGLNRNSYTGTNYAVGETYYTDDTGSLGNVGTGTEAYQGGSNLIYNDSFINDTKYINGANGKSYGYSQQKADSKNAVAWIPGVGAVDVTIINGEVQEGGLPEGTIITPKGSEKSYKINGANEGGYTTEDYTGDLSLERRLGTENAYGQSLVDDGNFPYNSYYGGGNVVINGNGGTGGGLVINGNGGGYSGNGNYSGSSGSFGRNTYDTYKPNDLVAPEFSYDNYNAYTPADLVAPEFTLDNYNAYESKDYVAPEYVDNAGKIVIPEMQENPYAKELEALLGQLKDYTPEEYMTIEEAIARANARLGSQYDANVDNIINQYNRDAISRGMFGQMPVEVIKQTALANNELERQAGINNLADSIRNQNINIVDRQNANALAGLEQQYNMTNDLYNKEYTNSRDAISDAYRNKQYQYQVDQDTYNRLYQDYRNNVADDFNNKQFAYQQDLDKYNRDYNAYRDSVSDDFRNKQWAYQQDVDEYNREYNAYRDSVSDDFRNKQWQYQLDQTEYEKAMQKLSVLGYADESVAALLGVPVGTPSNDVRLQEAQKAYQLEMMKYEDDLSRDRALFDSQLSMDMAQFNSQLGRDDYAYKSGIDYDEAARKAEMQYNYDVSLDNIRTGNDAYLKGLGGSSGGSSGSGSSSGSASYDGSTNPGSGKPYSYYYNLASDLTKDYLSANKNLEVDGYTFTTADLMTQDGIEKLAQMLWNRDYYGYNGNEVSIDPEDANDVSSLFPIGSMYPIPWLNPYENGAYDRVKNNGGSNKDYFYNQIN